MAILDGDSYVTSLPVIRKSGTLDEIMALFSSAVYKKVHILFSLHPAGFTLYVLASYGGNILTLKRLMNVHGVSFKCTRGSFIY
jgi:hypothetical protein